VTPRTRPGYGSLVSRVYPTRDGLIRGGMALVVLAVAAFAFTQSYSHIYDLARLHGESGTAARLLPLSVDGLIVAASLAILDGGRRDEPFSWLTWGMLVLGIVATIAGNIGYGYGYGPVGMIISSWPAAAFLGAMGIAEVKIRRSRSTPVSAAEVHVSGGIPDPYPGLWESMAANEHAEVESLSTFHEVPPVPEPEREGESPSLPLPEEAQIFAEDLAAGRVPGVRQIRQELGCGQPRAQQVRDELKALLAAGAPS
jgi:hypothetical protein